jgi:hypothetical protein
MNGSGLVGLNCLASTWIRWNEERNAYARCDIPASSAARLDNIDKAEALANALFEFVTDPYAPSRNERPVVQELHTFAPEMIAVLENMILDGVNERHYIDEYIHAIFGSMSVSRLTSPCPVS